MTSLSIEASLAVASVKKKTLHARLSSRTARTAFCGMEEFCEFGNHQVIQFVPLFQSVPDK